MNYHNVNPDMTIGDMVMSGVYGPFSDYIFSYMTPDHFDKKLGHSAFVLFYRTKQEPLMPKPMEDMYACIKDIEENAEEFKVQAGHYMVGGCSAGAIISAEIGTTNLGWQSGGVPKPELIFQAYTGIQMKLFYDEWEKQPEGSPEREGLALMLRRLAGPGFTREKLDAYELTDHIDGTYPPVYITANEDDKTVDVQNSYIFIDVCKKYGIPYRTKIGKTGDHGYGLGVGLEVEGWLDEAVQFWDQQTGRS